MAESSNIVAAQALGVMVASMTAGGQLLMSTCTVPGLLAIPSAQRLRAWQTFFDVGKLWGPGLGMTAASLHAYLAYSLWHSDPTRARLYGSAAAACFGILPFTVIVLMPTNSQLSAGLRAVEKKTDGQALSEQTSYDLVKKWGTLNAVRSCLPLLGAVLSVYATLKSS